MKTKYEIFLQWNTKFFLQKVLLLLLFGSCQNCMSSANLVAKLCNKRALSTGEPCTCEYVTLLLWLLLHRGYIKYTLVHSSKCSDYFFHASQFRRSFKTAIFSSFKTAIFSIFLKVAIATSNFMNEFYNSGFAPEFSVSRNDRASSRSCIWNEEIKSKTSGKIYIKTKYEIFLQ